MFSSKAAIISDCLFMSILFCCKVNISDDDVRAGVSPGPPSSSSPVPSASSCPSPAWLCPPHWLGLAVTSRYSPPQTETETHLDCAWGSGWPPALWRSWPAGWLRTLHWPHWRLEWLLSWTHSTLAGWRTGGTGEPETTSQSSRSQTLCKATCSKASSSSFSFLFSCSIFCLSLSFLSNCRLLISCCSFNVLSLQGVNRW